MDIGEVSIGEYTFLRVLQDSQLVSYLSDFGRLKSESRSVVSDSLQPHGLYSSWNSPDQNTGVGSRSLLQGNFPTGIEPRSPALWVDSLPAELPGKPTGPLSLHYFHITGRTTELVLGLLRGSAVAIFFFSSLTLMPVLSIEEHA